MIETTGPGGWARHVEPFFASNEGRHLQDFLTERTAAGAKIYPPQPLRALTLTPFDEVRAVILGQDPYHRAGQAHGLAFSVPEGVKPPPSLRNILAEVARDFGQMTSSNPLPHWARQGVLLLNAVLTVEDGAPGSHAGRGWEILTGRLVDALADDPQPKVFMLWGAHAQARSAGIGEPHLVLQANHPSPLSARRPPIPFIGCAHFSQANDFLASRRRGTIDWLGV